MNDVKKVMWTTGAQMLALALGLLTVFLIVWAASKAWKKGQAESNYVNPAKLGGYNFLAPSESGYNAPGYTDNWLGY